ncbi:hybrid sensor histidine kinase/response regulator [Algibacter mikhailovii]|uniref:histidine kinase n=1 Tax=Algibacter mikhailovii TaxID=425498 RepID=A0A918RBB0_9FLAO|nr:hybrid sensor histidine kinase/response regulator [Algibacter mikhailovii]
MIGQQLNRVEGFKQISTNEGLSHGDAINIIQDTNNFLWIGTNSGLNKYDGYTIEKHKWDPNNAESIPGNRIHKLIPSKDRIWILIQDKGLYCYDLLTLTFHLVIDVPKLAPNTFMLEIDQDKNIWFFHSNTGLITFSTNQTFINKNQSTKFNFKNISFDGASLRLPELKKMLEIDGKQFFFDIKGVVHVYDNTKKHVTHWSNLNKGQFIAAYNLDDNRTMVSCKKGLFIWNPNSKKLDKVLIENHAGFNNNNAVKTICKTDQTYFLGTEKGLYKGVFNLENQLEIEEVIPLVNINDVFIDTYNMLWVATSGNGLFYQNLRKLPFGHILQSNSTLANNNSLIQSFISAILKNKIDKEELWIGSRNGLSIYNIKTKEYITEIKRLRNKHIRFLFQDSEDDIWVGTKTDGLYRFRGKKLVKHYKKEIDVTNQISSNHIVSIAEDHLGQIWIANFNDGINIYNKKTDSFQHIFHEPFNKQSLGSNKLTYLYFNHGRKSMYISSRDSGLTVVDLKDSNEMRYSHIVADGAPNGLSINHTWTIISKNDDVLYIGTIGGGLNILEYQNDNLYTVESVTTALGLADNDIASVQIDSKNRIWIGGRGISVYDPNSKKISNYDVEDGLQSNSFKIGASFYDANDSIMYFGGVNGINFFNPGEIKSTITTTDIQITGVEIFNSPVAIGKNINDRILLHSKITDTTKIRLKAKENQFSINYKPLNYINPKKNSVKYKLEPYQKEWVTSFYPNHKATFSNLPKGNYTFRIKAANKDGLWSSDEAKLNIYIEPYWYFSNLAYLFYFIFISALFYSYHRYTSNRQKMVDKLMEAEKKHLLNQEKLDFFTKISHEIRTPLTLITGPLEDLIEDRETIQNKKDVLKSMRKHTNRLLNMANNLLDFRKMDLGHEVLTALPTEINEFTSEIFLFFKEKAASKNIDYQLIRSPKEITVYVDREKLETILINLLSNAFKFTPANGSISLKIELKGDGNKDAVFNDNEEPILNYLKIAIVDSGKGIHLKKMDKIFNQYYQLEKNNTFKTKGTGIGLALVKSICKLHHFKIDAVSKPNKGSIFSLRIPMGKAYLGSDEIQDENSHQFIQPVDAQNSVETLKDFEQTILDLIDKDTIITKKILIVEDNKEIQLYISNHVRKYFKVFTAENGKEGFEIAQRELPDVILSDVMMPIMDGMEFSRLIKTNKELHHIPIILLTAVTSTANELEGLKLGIEDYIRKPFKIELLLAKVFTILENRKYVADHYAKQLHFSPDSIGNLTDDDIFLQKTIQLIEENIENDSLNITFLCNAMAMGRTKLYTKIKELTDKSIVEFVRDIRIKKAGSLLVNTDQTVQEVILNVGLNDVKYFRKHFKAMFNQTPTEYRKSKGAITS